MQHAAQIGQMQTDMDADERQTECGARIMDDLPRAGNGERQPEGLGHEHTADDRQCPAHREQRVDRPADARFDRQFFVGQPPRHARDPFAVKQHVDGK